MKTPPFLLLLAAALALVSCESLPLVSDRDADGNPQVPVCPKCGEHFSKSATIYQDKNNHFGVSVQWHGDLGADTTKLKTAP